MSCDLFSITIAVNYPSYEKLNGWQSIGLILSIVLVLGVAKHKRNGQVELIRRMVA